MFVRTEPQPAVRGPADADTVRPHRDDLARLVPRVGVVVDEPVAGLQVAGFGGGHDSPPFGVISIRPHSLTWNVAPEITYFHTRISNSGWSISSPTPPASLVRFSRATWRAKCSRCLRPRGFQLSAFVSIISARPPGVPLSACAGSTLMMSESPGSPHFTYWPRASVKPPVFWRLWSMPRKRRYA